jgi:hypothetical protein
VDFVIATDNRSVDKTPNILRDYEARGLLRYIFEEMDNYNQRAWVTRMARIAYTEYGADWVINNDADEFWWPMDSTLKTVFSNVPDEVNIVKAERCNFVPVENSDSPFWSRMLYRERVSLNPLGNPLPPKVAHRGSPSVQVSQGNHSVTGIDKPVAAQDLIEILHFPIRSYAQIENKIAKGGAAYERNTELSESAGITWRKLHSELKRDNCLGRYYRAHLHDEQRLTDKLRLGELIVDRRLADELSKILNQPHEHPDRP